MKKIISNYHTHTYRCGHVNYFGECYLDCQMVLQDKYVRVVAKDGIRVILEFCITPTDNNCMFNYRGKYYLYTPKLFKTIMIMIGGAESAHSAVLNMKICKVFRTR